MIMRAGAKRFDLQTRLTYSDQRRSALVATQKPTLTTTGARWTQPLLPLVYGLALAACAQGGPRANQPSSFVLSVVGTNDLHGHIDHLAWFSGYLNNLREARKKDGAVVLLDGGDMFQGTLASNLGEGQVVVEAYNHLGYDAAAIGNHEFDFGPEGPAAAPLAAADDPRGALKARARQARFPFLTANVKEEATNRILQGKNISATAMFTRNGVTVGLIGVTTQDTARATLARNFAGLKISALASTIAQHASELRVRGAHVIIVAAHAGAACHDFSAPQDLRSCVGNKEIFDVAQALPPRLVDAIVAGHTHAGVAHEAAGIPIIEAHSYGRAFGRVDLVLDRKTKRVLRHRLFPPQDICADTRAGTCMTKAYEARPVQADQTLARLISRSLAHVKQVAERPLNSQALATIPRAYKVESALGNLFTDLMLAARPAAHVAITNGGGLRQDIPQGPMRYEHLYEAMPFDNTFATAEITAAQLADVFRRNLQSDKGILSVSGLRVRARCENNALEVRLLRDDGAPIAANKRLILLTTDFLATGGDGLLKGIKFNLEEMPPVRDEMGRVLAANPKDYDPQVLLDPSRPRLIYPAPRPVRCDL